MRTEAGIGMTSMRTRKRLIDRLSEQGIQDEHVLSLIESTPRHLFLEEAMAHRAYENKSLPIGFGQTISQPYIVAKMTELILGDNGRDSVLEIGTGSGYQTALLSKCFRAVYTTERIEPLQQKAKALLRSLGYDGINYFLADGGLGLKRYAPFDAIISTCAPEEIPQSLLYELSAEGGRLVIPVGEQQQTQYLTLVERNGDVFSTTIVEPVVFVPLVSGLSK